MPNTSLTQNPSFYSDKLTTYGFAFVAIVIFCFTMPVTKLLAPIFSPFFVAASRGVVGGIAALLILMTWRCPLPAKHHWLGIFWVALGLVLLFPMLASLGLQTTDASHAGIIGALLPLGTALVASRWHHERPLRRFWWCALSATLLVVLFSGFKIKGGLNIGDAWLFASLPFACVGYAMGGRLAQLMPGWQVMCWALVFSLPITLPILMIEWPKNSQAISLGYWQLLVYLGLFSQLLGLILWNKAMAKGGIAKISQLQLLQPFGTLVAAYWVMNEALEPLAMMLLALVAMLVYAGQKASTQ